MLSIVSVESSTAFTGFEDNLKNDWETLPFWGA